MCGYVQCDIKVPKHRTEKLANFQTFFQIKKICRQNIELVLQECAEKEGLLSQPRRTFFLLWASQQYLKNLLATVLFGAGTLLHTNFSLHWVHPFQTFRQFSAISTQSSLSRKQEAKLHWCGRHYEAACQPFVCVFFARLPSLLGYLLHEWHRHIQQSGKKF